MLGLKKTALAAAGITALALAPITPAAAAGALIVPWLIARHVVGAVVGLATLPLVVASLAAGQQAAPYPPTPDYGGSPSYYPPPNYYGRPPTYYAGSQRYYRPAVHYARAVPRFYETPRGYYAPHTRYTGAYGAHVPYQSGRFADYRRR
jgi:hypothetical protein